jgi:hypothetical protein
MTVIRYPQELLSGSMPFIDSAGLSAEHYRRLGVAVVRKAVPAVLINSWCDAWQKFYEAHLVHGRKVDPYNPVVLQEEAPQILNEIHMHPVLVDLMGKLYPDVALYMQRFLIKDRQSQEPVFLHQDCCYDIGWLEKTSMFLPLSIMNSDNGGLMFYPGTHLLGYLGDAGELNSEILEPDWPIVHPEVEPGDVVLMHECTWHSSGSFVQGYDRIVVQITFQPAGDPSGTKLLRGKSSTSMGLGSIDRERLFIRNRSSRLRELQDAVRSATPCKQRM